MEIKEADLIFDRQLKIEDWNQKLISESELEALDQEDVGKLKVQAAKDNSVFHNVANTEIETYNFDIVKNFSKTIELCKNSNVVFNMIDYGDYFDLAIQSLCLKFQIPLICGGTFSTTITVDVFYPEGAPCFFCATDDLKKEIYEKLTPENILTHQDLSFLPKNNNPVGQSNVFLCSACGNFMVSAFVHFIMKNEEAKKVKRIVFYMNNFESMSFPIEKKNNCPFCKTQFDEIKKYEDEIEIQKKLFEKKDDDKEMITNEIKRLNDLISKKKEELGKENK